MVYRYGGNRLRKGPDGKLLAWYAARDEWAPAPIGIVLRSPVESLGSLVLRLARSAVSATVTAGVLWLAVALMFALAKPWL